MSAQSDAQAARWETVVGLEVHVELATATKLFSAAPNAFGAAPNTNVTPVCLGLPGALPVLNEHAVTLAATIGLALNCAIAPCVFHRKNYFYPDMPKNYQVSQYDAPLCVDGHIELPDDGHTVRIQRAHLEEDAGKNTHVGGADGRIHGASGALIDYNRAGVALLEIVTHPDLRGGADARAFVEELRATLRATGASDARMEEGSLRVDANISVRPTGSDELRTRCEVKNLNSLRSLTRAIEHEAARHIALYEAGEHPAQQTRHWGEDGRTHTLRSKEEENDYRYFPEPDLVPVELSDELIAELRAHLGELPPAQRRRLTDAGVSATDASTLVARGTASLVLDAAAATAASSVDDTDAVTARAALHAVNNLGDETELGLLTPAALGELARLEVSGQLTATQAKTVLAELVTSGGDPADIAAARGFEAMDQGALDVLVDEAIAANPQAWAKFTSGEDKVAGVFVGAVMAATKGQADGGEVTKLLRARRDAA